MGCGSDRLSKNRINVQRDQTVVMSKGYRTPSTGPMILKYKAKRHAWKSTLNWITFVGGVLLFIAPLANDYGGPATALWTSLIMGIVFMGLGYMKSYRTAAAAGLITLVLPGLFGFNGIEAARWNFLIIGGVIAITNGYSEYLPG